MREQVICGLCRVVCRNAHLSENPLCGACLARARGGVQSVTCPAELLPLRAHILYGAVPYAATSADFHNAVSAAFNNDDPAARWRVEAVRARLHRPGCAIGESK